MKKDRCVGRAILGVLIVLAVLGAAISARSEPDKALGGRETVVDSVGHTTGRTAPGFVFGVSGRADSKRGPLAARSLKASLTRVEWDISTQPSAMASVVSGYARVGSRVQPIAGFVGRLPSYSEAQNLRAWALRFGPKGTFWRTAAARRLAVTHIEFGNETSYGYQYGDDVGSESYAQRARAYAQAARDAGLALRGTGVTLLVQADDAGSERSNWVDEMFAAVPDLASYAAGWVVHPYGPSGSERINRTIAYLTANRVRRASIRIYVTEWGLASADGRMLDDNYGNPANMTYTQAAHLLSSTVAKWRKTYGARLAEMILFQDYDSRRPGASNGREDYFGALRVNGRDKGLYTAEVRRQLAVARAG